jgi:hypothetical protein
MPIFELLVHTRFDEEGEIIDVPEDDLAWVIYGFLSKYVT